MGKLGEIFGSFYNWLVAKRLVLAAINICILPDKCLNNRYLINFFIFLQKNALIGGAITGALISAASNNNKDKVMVDAITGGAIATAAKFLNYLT